jgi:hypothetical protein
MTTYVMPFWLWVGIVVFVLSVIIPAIVRIFRKPNPDSIRVRHDSRLKIISAYYGGIHGESDEEVTEKYLQPRIQGDALVGWVGANLFGAFQPVINLPKRLKIRYSFNGGEEKTVVRQENELLVLPEDTYLKGMDAPTSIKLRDELEKTQYIRAHDLGLEVSELFTPLQIEAFQMSRELRLLVRNAGNKPRLDPGDYPPSVEGTAAYSNEWDNTVGLWVAKLTHRYALDYGSRVKKLVHKFGIEGLSDEGLEMNAESVNSEMGIIYVAKALTDLALKMDFIRLLQDEEKK